MGKFFKFLHLLDKIQRDNSYLTNFGSMDVKKAFLMVCVLYAHMCVCVCEGGDERAGFWEKVKMVLKIVEEIIKYLGGFVAFVQVGLWCYACITGKKKRCVLNLDLCRCRRERKKEREEEEWVEAWKVYGWV